MTLPADEFSLRITGPRHLVSAQWRRQGSSEREADPVNIDPLRERTVEVLVGLLRRNRLQEDHELKLLGEHLYVTLFKTPDGEDNGPGALLRQAMQGKGSPDESSEPMLRVSLEFDADNGKYASWPWEYLFVPPRHNDPESNLFLSRSTKMVLTRRMTVDTPAGEIHVQPPLKVLFAALSPEGLAEVDYESVMRMFLRFRDSKPSQAHLRIFSPRHAQDGTPYQDPVDPDELTYPSFADAVSEFNPHVIHIIGHGRYVHGDNHEARGQLAFPLDAKPQWVDDSQLAEELRGTPDLRLVFFQACETATTSSHPHQAISGMAQSLAQRGIPAVIGMHFEVKSVVANKFARAFYDPLVQHKSIEVALHAGRRTLRLAASSTAEGRNFGMPVLYLREYSPLLTARPGAPSSKSGGVTLRGGEPATAPPDPRLRTGESLLRGDELLEPQRSTRTVSGARNHG
ncbi:CHAT domain-containing protein [Amycolatopsis sp. NPDC004625]|uniref:CHAT domain-containing protein n=1 Tax=Amycolatopsis sp. NPDC004625 TaxID=3154670 RepID=UPI0033AAC786